MLAFLLFHLYILESIRATEQQPNNNILPDGIKEQKQKSPEFSYYPSLSI
jgi:hypothetical protein